MRIERFQYHDQVLQWRLGETFFSDLTLLVGVSGVGKTQILRALLNVKRIALGRVLNGLKWEMTFTTRDNHCYLWQGEFETLDRPVLDELDLGGDADSPSSDKPRLLSESLHLDGDEIIRRNDREITFKGDRIPRLSPSVSVVSLLSEEDDVAPAYEAFQSVLHSDQSSPSQPYNQIPFSAFDKLKERYGTLADIQHSELPTQLKLALVSECEPEVFATIRDRFIEIFPQVVGMKVEPVSDDRFPPFIVPTRVIQIKEKGVSEWIHQRQISSGMLRTIFHLAEMYLWPEGTVILIDEFENSLGVNCIDVLTEDLLQPHRSLQFIITSHHPYVINNVGPEHWKVVRRKGGVVTTHDAKSLGLSQSSHEAFIQLLNNEEYREGIAAS